MAAQRPGRVRIIGGSVRNSRLEVPAVEGLRPTSERVRETLFNWLTPVIEGADCLDLFAGTGALGIEALSRGAASAVLVDADRRAVQAIEANVARLQGIEATTVSASWETFLARPPRPFDLVFLDPPFALGLWQRVADRLEAGGWLRANAWIYVESARGSSFTPPPGWLLHREGAAGEVVFALYRRHRVDRLS
ncbi:16S rRNA (guanine(966)-N(2))-methyltransferase RsmD [Pinirhizobacter sp.]|jgi:16S rRNA (guanine966-N2)-methyltransferase|uniref:16S rRNA (guanine(966)-N(2))-methyltransferase RsmD n=1 Tax=Pinirhizobacter sp. TaxID=2950432 RepID=UPI002F426001